MNDNRSNFGNQWNPWGPMSALTEQWLMAMRPWTDAWSAFIPGGWPPQAWNSGGGTGYSNAGPMPAVSVQVWSKRPAEVTAQLCAGPDLIALTADALRGEGFAAPLIEQVSITREPGRVRVRVEIGAGQPAGCYRGAIRKKADGSIAGELTVVITEPVCEPA